MRIVVLGATGAVGRHVVQYALAADYEVVAYIRNASKMTVHHPDLLVVEGSLSDLARLEKALHDTVAVVSALGVSHRTPDKQPSQQLPVILEAMQKAGVSRYIGLSSGAAVNMPGDRKPLAAKIMGHILNTFRHTAVEDKRRELDTLRQQSTVTWTLARPTRLIGDTLTQEYKATAHRPRRLWTSRADVAHFLVQQVSDNQWDNQAPFIS
ncbi:MAG: NAD(P)H-binding protein [Anaerolineales bacterium]|nr:NAD(P)H-binding protein [Anaerolineales bacterium]